MIKIITLIIAGKKLYKSDFVQGIVQDKENQEMVKSIIKKTLKKLSR